MLLGAASGPALHGVAIRVGADPAFIAFSMLLGACSHSLDQRSAKSVWRSALNALKHDQSAH